MIHIGAPGKTLEIWCCMPLIAVDRHMLRRHRIKNQNNDIRFMICLFFWGSPGAEKAAAPRKTLISFKKSRRLICFIFATPQNKNLIPITTRENTERGRKIQRKTVVRSDMRSENFLRTGQREITIVREAAITADMRIHTPGFIIFCTISSAGRK